MDRDLPLQNLTVLVAEDSPLQRAHAVQILRALGAEAVFEASDGHHALEILTHHPDVAFLLSDLDMPRLDGVALIGELAARGFRPRMAVLSAQDPSILRAVKLMAETYGLPLAGTLEKPLTLHALEAILQLPHPQALPEARSTGLPGLDEIRAGLQSHAFTCFFQPQLTMQGALFRALEALVRWRHPTLGLLGPAAFLPTMEREDALLDTLTLAVLHEVADQWHTWARRGMTLDVSVNLSARSLSHPGFADRLMETATALHLPPRHLVFELTESASVSHLGHTLANLARLRIQGYKLAIDDFGTGYATFEQLERIPFTELKLDRSIVMHLPLSERHRIMARRMLQMARDLKLHTVAEGVETMEQWETLLDLGCERAQGYLAARPMPGDEIPDWAHQDRRWLRNRGNP